MKPLAITQVSASDTGGGAEAVALDLHRRLRERGHDAWLAVGRTLSSEEGVVRIDHARTAGRVGTQGWALHRRLVDKGRWRAARAARALAEPGTALDLLRGHEDFRFPGSYDLERLTPRPPDVIHAHNLHGGFFDPRALPPLSQRGPVVVTLHDAWLFTGHCAHPLDSDGWRRGCGNCPHLSTYPALHRDGTAFNLARKADLHRRSRLTVVAPSRWLLNLAEASVLASAIVAARVIPNGVDIDLFSPRDRGEARRSLAVPDDAYVLVFSAAGGRANAWKDYGTLQAALASLDAGGRTNVLLVVGEDGPPEHAGSFVVAPVGALGRDRVPAVLAAADVYVHPAAADTFPLAVLEALSMGLPVVATAVGGIPEQIAPLGGSAEPTGVLVPPADVPRLAAALARLRDDAQLRRELGGAARRAAVARFGAARVADDYEALYREALESRGAAAAR